MMRQRGRVSGDLVKAGECANCGERRWAGFGRRGGRVYPPAVWWSAFLSALCVTVCIAAMVRYKKGLAWRVIPQIG